MAKTSKIVKKLGKQTQTGNMQHKDCPCTKAKSCQPRRKTAKKDACYSKVKARYKVFRQLMLVCFSTL